MELGVAHCVSRDALGEALDAASGCGIRLPALADLLRVAADIRGLVEEAHQQRKPVVVDEAWGGHFAFSPRLPEAATAAAADLVISSTHKMAGSLTQSAMLHLGPSPLGFDEAIVDRAVTALESTSRTPSWAAPWMRRARGWPRAARRRSRARSTPSPASTRRSAIVSASMCSTTRPSAPTPFTTSICCDCASIRGHGTSAPAPWAMRCERAACFPELIADNVIVATLAPGEDEDHISLLVRALERALSCTRARRDGRAPEPSADSRADGPHSEAGVAGSREPVPLRDAVGRVSPTPWPCIRRDSERGAGRGHDRGAGRLPRRIGPEGPSSAAAGIATWAL